MVTFRKSSLLALVGILSTLSLSTWAQVPSERSRAQANLCAQAPNYQPPTPTVGDGSNAAQARTDVSTTDGSISALLIDPARPAIVYAGKRGGGVYKSIDEGATWAASDLINRSVSALSIDPTTPTTLYAGADQCVYKSTNGGWTAVACGASTTVLAVDPMAPNNVYIGGYGVTKSTNGGHHWTHTGPDALVEAIAIDPTVPSTLYVGSVGGWPAAFKTTDAGVTWHTVTTGLTSHGVNALAIDPTATSTLYAGTERGVFKSTDGSHTWGATGLIEGDVRTLVIDPTASGTLYAGTSSGVFKSVDGGGNWSSASTGLNDTGVSVLALSPTTPQTLYAGTGSGVYKSADGGASWHSINTGLNIVPPPPTPTPINLRTALIPEDAEGTKTYQQIQSLFGPNQWVRETQPFTTERGKPAMFVLLITGPPKEGVQPATGPEVERSHCYDEDDPRYAPWAGCDIFGVTWINGEYSVALVIDGAVVNSVPLPLESGMLPLTGFHRLNHEIWGQGEAYPEGDRRNAEVERTKLMNLADYNGDGHAWEFRLVQYADSSSTDTILVGYSARQRKVIIYQAIGDPNPEAPDNFFPSPNSPDARKVHYEFICGNHGSEQGVVRDFVYDAEKEAWVKTHEELTYCGVPTPTPNAALSIAVGSATAFAGDDVGFDVRLVNCPAALNVVSSVLRIDAPVQFSMTDCSPAENLDPRCEVHFNVSDQGRETQLRVVMHCPDPLPSGSVLYRCTAHSTADSPIGSYTVHVVEVGAYQAGAAADRVRGVGADGNVTLSERPRM